MTTTRAEAFDVEMLREAAESAFCVLDAKEYPHVVAKLKAALSLPPKAIDEAFDVERVGEALFVLSDRLRKIGALDSDNVHAAYEKVVAEFQALSALKSQPATDERRGLLELYEARSAPPERGAHIEGGE